MARTLYRILGIIALPVPLYAPSLDAELGLGEVNRSRASQEHPLHATPAEERTVATKPLRMDATYIRLPLAFEANTGQSDPIVKFQSRAPGYSLFVTPTETVLVLQPPARKTKTKAPPDAGDTSPNGVDVHASGTRMEPVDATRPLVLRVQLVGANPAPDIGRLEPLPGVVNYIPTSDPAYWRTNIPTYAKVRYRDVYPGIDLVYYGNQQQLEYDFVVAPGRIRFQVEGADRLDLTPEGDLALVVQRGTILLKRPRIYQEVNGTRAENRGGYALRREEGASASGPEIAFQLAPYDTAKPLVIDPELAYSTFVGGWWEAWGYGVAVDASGSAYVTGRAWHLQFPVTPGAFKSVGSAFVTKLNATGTGLIFSTLLGGSYDDMAYALAMDAAGNSYITSETASPNFPTTPGAFGSTCDQPLPWSICPFATKLNATDTALVYQKQR